MQESMTTTKNGWEAFNAVQPFYSVELSKSFGEAWIAETALTSISKITIEANKVFLISLDQYFDDKPYLNVEFFSLSSTESPI